MKNTEQILKDIERDLVINITLNVKYGRIDLREAREIAREFMAGYPYSNMEELFGKIDFLSDKYRLVRKVYVKHVPQYHIEQSQKILKEMQKFIDKGEVEEAIIIAKGGIYGR